MLKGTLREKLNQLARPIESIYLVHVLFHGLNAEMKTGHLIRHARPGMIQIIQDVVQTLTKSNHGLMIKGRWTMGLSAIIPASREAATILGEIVELSMMYGAAQFTRVEWELPIQRIRAGLREVDSATLDKLETLL